MKINLQQSGLLAPQQLASWLPQQRRALRLAVASVMRVHGQVLTATLRQAMHSVFSVRKPAFVKSLRMKVYAEQPAKFPALYIGSKIPWLGLHTRGGAIQGRMLIPLLPEHQRLGRKAFKRIVDGLVRSGNAFFIKKNGQVILMAENIRENSRELARFRRAERARTGAKSIKRGQELPIALLVPVVRLKKRFDLQGQVQRQLPRLARAIAAALNR